MSLNVGFKDLYDQRAEFTGLEYGSDRYTFRLISKYFKKGQLVLDLGCGRGSFLNPLADKGVHVMGMDYSWRNVKLLREADRMVILGDALDSLPFRKNSFDSVICSEFLEHFQLKDVHIIMRNISHVLRPGGYFFLTVPKNEKLQASQCICPNCKLSFHRWGHLTSFNEKLIEELLAANNLVLKKSMVVYGASLFKINVPLLLIRFLSLFDFGFPRINMTLGTYLVIATKH